VKNTAKHVDFFSKSGKSLLISLHIPAPHSRSHATCNVVARVQNFSYWTPSALVKHRYNKTEREHDLSLTLGEDNRSVQNSHRKTNSCTKQPEKTTIPHGILALNAIPLHHNTMKDDRSTPKNSHPEYHSFNTTRRRQFLTEFLPLINTVLLQNTPNKTTVPHLRTLTLLTVPLRNISRRQPFWQGILTLQNLISFEKRFQKVEFWN
jgi:hypothetical protein